jgi:ClpP class serine protease
MFQVNCSGLVLFLILLFVIFVVVLPSIGRSRTKGSRQSLIRRLELKRSSRVIVMIHRQESVSFLGVPLSRYIDIEDSEQVLRAIHLTKPDVPIDIILHTPGGLVLAAEQIATALVRHEARVTVMVPHYAMSGGTLMALAADQILMDPNAVLGPVDPQLGNMPAAGYVELLERKDVNKISDESLMLASMSEKALRQVHDSVVRLLRANGMDEGKAKELADALSSGRWTHDYPIFYEEARELGLPVSDVLPDEVYQLMEHYPQSSGRRPSVQYVPMPYRGTGDTPED